MREHEDETPFAESQTASADSRQSIWTIRAEWIGWFYLLFILQAFALITTLWSSENHGGSHDNIASTITAIVSGSASLIFVAATATVIELEVVMVLKTLLERHFEKKDREKAEQERQAELERDKAEKTEQRLREAYEQGRRDEREALAQHRSTDDNNG